MFKRVLYIVSIGVISGTLYGQALTGTYSSNATAFNNGRHLVFLPNSPIAHIVYHSFNPTTSQFEGYLIRYYVGDPPWEQIIEIPDPDGGNVAFPAIAITTFREGDTIIAIPYLTGTTYYLQMPVPTGSPRVAIYLPGRVSPWYFVDIPLGGGGRVGPPSITLFHYRVMGGEDNPIMAYEFVVTFAYYNTCRSPMPQDIELWAVIVIINPDGSVEIPTPQLITSWDEGSAAGYNITNPSTAVFELGEYTYFHTTWERGGTVIRYAVSRVPYGEINPSGQIDCINFETGHRPFIHTYGDRIFLSWESGSPAEIYRRWRDGNQSDDEDLTMHWTPSRNPYSPPHNMSTWDNDWSTHNSSSINSVYPQGSESSVAWVEEDGCLGYDNVFFRDYDYSPGPVDIDFGLNARYLGCDEAFPHIWTREEFNERGAHVNTCWWFVWTIPTLPGAPWPEPYSIYFDEYYGDYDHPIGYATSRRSPTERIQIPSTVPVYYWIDCGNPEPSHYCKKRDNAVSFNGRSVDMGEEELLYNLPLLEYPYYYLIRAIVSVPKSISETFFFDNRGITLSVSPTKSETLDYILPEELYSKDKQVALKIEGNEEAYLEKLLVYRFEIIESSPKQSRRGVSSLNQHISSGLYISPNPFRADVNIRYQIAQKGRVALGVYDIAGRLVRTLVNTSALCPGIYTVRWDGKDKNGEELPAGLYFMRLKTEGGTMMRKVMLLR